MTKYAVAYWYINGDEMEIKFVDANTSLDALEAVFQDCEIDALTEAEFLQQLYDQDIVANYKEITQ